MNKTGRNSKFEKTITINTTSIWIGDPMYALSHERFVNIPDDGPIVLDGTEIGIVHRTQGGDGTFPGSKRKEYWVDSAKLSISLRSYMNSRIL